MTMLATSTYDPAPGRQVSRAHTDDVLDQNGALLYPGKIGPFVPRGDRRNGRARAQDLLQVPNEAFDQACLL
jgi:hypothetical protein